MARIRSIKPDFFLDPDLAELDHKARLAFIGLWCHADKSGRLEDEPKKLKVLIFPYELIDMDKTLAQLSIKPFVIRYQSNNRKYLQIVNFHKHQKPHHTERDSLIPAFDGEITVKEPSKDGDSPVGTVIGKGISVIGKCSSNNIPPTLETLLEVIPDRLEAERFFDHFESNGWLVGGKAKMRDWRAAARNWLRNKKQWSNDGVQPKTKTKIHMSYEELEAQRERHRKEDEEKAKRATGDKSGEAVGVF